MIKHSEIKGQEIDGAKCIYFTFGVDHDYEADLLGLKIISELKESGYVVAGYGDRPQYWDHEDKWGVEVWIR